MRPSRTGSDTDNRATLTHPSVCVRAACLCVCKHGVTDGCMLCIARSLSREEARSEHLHEEGQDDDLHVGPPRYATPGHAFQPASNPDPTALTAVPNCWSNARQEATALHNGTGPGSATIRWSPRAVAGFIEWGGFFVKCVKVKWRAAGGVGGGAPRSSAPMNCVQYFSFRPRRRRRRR